MDPSLNKFFGLAFVCIFGFYMLNMGPKWRPEWGFIHVKSAIGSIILSIRVDHAGIVDAKPISPGSEHNLIAPGSL